MYRTKWHCKKNYSHIQSNHIAYNFFRLIQTMSLQIYISYNLIEWTYKNCLSCMKIILIEIKWKQLEIRSYIFLISSSSFFLKKEHGRWKFLLVEVTLINDNYITSLQGFKFRLLRLYCDTITSQMNWMTNRSGESKFDSWMNIF